MLSASRLNTLVSSDNLARVVSQAIAERVHGLSTTAFCALWEQVRDDADRLSHDECLADLKKVLSTLVKVHAAKELQSRLKNAGVL